MAEEQILSQVEKEIKKRNLPKEQIAKVLASYPPITNRRIIGGMASATIYDREGHKITYEAWKDALPRFMEQLYWRPIQTFHSDIPVGRVLPKWTNPQTGETYTTHADEKGLWIVAELRDDVEIADKVWEEILKDNIKSFSVAGSSKNREAKNNGQFDINALDLYEISLCETPVNQLSKFEVLLNPEKVEIGTGLD